MKILFLGAGAFAVPTLAALIAERSPARIAAIITQPDRPAGRGRTLTPTPIGQFAAEHAPAVPLLKPADVNAPEVLAQLAGFDADAAVVIAFGQKLSPALVATVRDGRMMNLHGSLLPRWRGAGPVNAAILHGDAVTGNTVITIAPRMDAGLILSRPRTPRPITPLTTAGELHDALAADGVELVLEVLRDVPGAFARATMQDESLVTKARKLGRADARLSESLTAAAARARIHGLTPWPGVSVSLGGLTLKLLRVMDEPAEQMRPPAAPGGATPAPDSQQPSPGGQPQAPFGTLLDADAGILAMADRTRLRILEAQPAGGRAMTWADLRRGAGRTLTAGVVLSQPIDQPPNATAGA